MIRRQVVARPCSLKRCSCHLPPESFLSKSTWSDSENLFFPWWPQYQYLRELLVKHWDIKRVSRKPCSIWCLFWFHTGKKWLHKTKHAKNSSLLHSNIPSLTLPLTLQVILWSLQTKKIKNTTVGKKKKEEERYKTVLKKNPGQKKREATNEGEDKQAGTKLLTPKIDEEIVVASRLYGRVSITDSTLVQPTGKEKDITSRNTVGRAGQSGNSTNRRRGQM